MTRGARIFFLLARRVPPVLSPVLAQVFGLLRARGFRVDSGIAEELLTRPDQLAVEHDLYVLKSHTELALSLAGVLHLQGARLLNPFPNCAVTQNKIVASRLLAAAGVPTPRCWVTGDLRLLESVVREGPLIIKPYLGHRGAGLHIARSPVDLALVPPPEESGGPFIVQDYVGGGSEDLKVYVVDRDVFAVRKPFSPASFSVPGRPCPVEPPVRDIALRCGRAFGLGLYGLDVVEGDGGPWVVDLNTFPGYKGVPDVAPRIAEYIARYADGLLTLDAPEIQASPASPPTVPA